MKFYQLRWLIADFIIILLIVFVLAYFFFLPNVKNNTNNINKVIAEDEFKMVSANLNYSKGREAFFNLRGVLSTENDKQVLLTMGDNAISLFDPESLETIAKKLEEIASKNVEDKKKIEQFKLKASEFYGIRARRERFHGENVVLRIEKVDKLLKDNPNNNNLLEQKSFLKKTEEILYEKYPKDAQKAIVLNPSNSRALYDLNKYLMWKSDGYDRIEVIKNFEKVVEVGNGKSEKDGDYLFANLNLTILYFEIGNLAKARCYSAQTLEKHLATSKLEYDYLLGKQVNGQFNEPGFMKATEQVNPNKELIHEDCGKIPN